MLELGLNADPEERTVDLYATPSELKDWTRPGVSAFLEISTEQVDDSSLAIPLSAVVRDGLTSIIFRRDPANPDKAIRLEADLGMNDGRWIVINSGLREGDEVVLDGVYQLLLATSGSIPKGGPLSCGWDVSRGGRPLDVYELKSKRQGEAIMTWHGLWGVAGMLKHLIAFSLKYSALVLIAAGLLVFFAAYQLPRMPVDVFPELNAPTVVILAEAGGLAADEVEQYVTFPLETAVNGLDGVRRVRSSSAISLALVWVEFEWGTDIYRARQLVSERLSAARASLPASAHAEITPITSITGEIMLLALSSPDNSVSDLDLRAYSEFEMRNRLLAIPGVAQVVSIGGELPEYQVHVRQNELQLYGLTVEDVVNAAQQAHSTASAGYLPNVGNRELPMRQSTQVRSVDDIRNTLIKYHEGSPVTIGQVADVQLGGAPKRGTAADRGKPAVVMSIQKSPGDQHAGLTRAMDAALDEIEASLPKGIAINRQVMRQSDFHRTIGVQCGKVLRDATIIVSIILILFLLNVRTTFITLTALPLSIAAALLLLWVTGLTINVMTLGGLAVAIGELVDDAIIDVENVYRRLRENQALPAAEQRPSLDVIFDASNEIRSSVVFATVIIVIVFVPLLFLGGLEGRFFRPLGLTYIASILASLVVALTVTPALCKYLLAKNLPALGMAANC